MIAGKKSDIRFNLACLFILYRGASMLDDWIENYAKINDQDQESKDEYKKIYLSGNSSCTCNIKIALQFAYK